MTLAFAFRPRRVPQDFVPVEIGETVCFNERVEYVLSFPGGCSPSNASRLSELGGSLISDDIGILSFGNFVGRAEFAAANIDVVSTKIGEGGVSRILEEVSELSASLIFGWRSPAGFEAAANVSTYLPVVYHQLQFLRRVMMKKRPGERLQDWLEAIERNPTRRFEPERPVLSPDRVRRLDHRAVQSIFNRVDRLGAVPAGSTIACSELAQALTFGTPPQPHFPSRIAAPRGYLSFDTPENRVVKHVVRECLALVYRFVDHPNLHASLRNDCRYMLSTLEQFAGARFLDEVGALLGFTTPTQALVKSDGYREVFTFWNALNQHVSLPRDVAETTRLLEGRDMATLYEYWVFVKVLESVSNVMCLMPDGPPTIRRDELGESLVIGMSAPVGPSVLVSYNPSYMRSRGTSYSTPLRPDVVVEIGGRRHAFDAKYRLDRFDVAEGDPDDGAATYKRADLYKMHTYRDAIADLRTAFVVYPGSEFVFFERGGDKRLTPDTLLLADGVGAVPLRPATPNPADSLETLLAKLLTAPTEEPFAN